MRGFLLEMEWWHPDLSAQLLPPPLKWVTSQSSHAFVCRQQQSPMGRPRLVSCSAGRLVILPGAWVWLFCFVWDYKNFFSLMSAKLSCPFWCAVGSASLAHPGVSGNSHTTLGKSRTWETSHLSCCLPLWRTASQGGVVLSSLTPGHWCGVEGSGTCSLRAGRAAALQIFLGHLLSVSLPLLERTGLADSKLSLLKQLNGDLMVSEINLHLSRILLFSGMFVKQVSTVAQWTEV